MGLIEPSPHIPHDPANSTKTPESITFGTPIPPPLPEAPRDVLHTPLTKDEIQAKHDFEELQSKLSQVKPSLAVQAYGKIFDVIGFLKKTEQHGKKISFRNAMMESFSTVALSLSTLGYKVMETTSIHYQKVDLIGEFSKGNEETFKKLATALLP
jgi:hypothetical protein